MKLLVLGINHQTAPVSLRERVSFPDAALPRALGELRGLDRVHEAAVLSTCNRTEVYAVAEGEDGGEAVAHWLAAQAGEEGASLQDYLYRHADADAARHLFRVATGLDSLVLGEPQILGQVKQAWAGARGAGSLGAQLDRLFQHAFTTAKRARTDTLIGANPVSVASAAVRLAQESFAPLEDSTVLLVGAGETIELAARHLAQARVRRLMVANRTLTHAQDLASRHGGVALPLQDIRQHLGEADVVISATAAREPILDVDHFTHALAQRRHRPMLALDLAVPRDIAPAVGALGDVYLYTVDDLERSVEDNRRSRRDAAQAAEAIIDLQVGRFMEGQAVRAGSAPIRQLRAQAEAARGEVLQRARARLAAGQEPDEVLAYLAHTLTNRVLHTPTLALREAAANGDRELLRVAGRLFGATPDSEKP